MAYSPTILGVISTANSSTANLAAAAVFTGTSEDVTNYSSIKVTIFSSHASATDGLSIQQSVDGTNWDSIDVYTISAATVKTISTPVVAKFFRLVYTNGATLTTSLRIQTVYHTSAKQTSSQRPQDGRSNDNDFEETLAFNMIYNGTTWDRLRGTGGAVNVLFSPATSGGLTTFHLVSAATTNATVVKASAGQVFGWFIYNSNAAARKLVFHNAATTPTAGASVLFSLVIPPGSGANVEMSNGIVFSTGIAITTVTGLADNDTAAVALNDLIINIFYK